MKLHVIMDTRTDRIQRLHGAFLTRGAAEEELSHFGPKTKAHMEIHEVDLDTDKCQHGGCKGRVDTLVCGHCRSY